MRDLSALARLIDAGIDDTDDPEEKRRRIQAKIEAENFGAALGLTIGVASVIADRLSERHQTSNQPEEPMDTEYPEEPTSPAGPDKTISAEAPEQESAEQVAPEEPEQNPAAQLTPEELEALEILEQEEYNEFQAQSDLWQMTM